MTYRVKAGVDLWLLAAWYYGDPGLWDIIYYENVEVIGDDPDNLQPGMTLEIPGIEPAAGTYLVPAVEAV